MSLYTENRRRFYSKFPTFWSELYGSEYSLYHVLPITEEMVCKIKQATERMGQVFFKTAELLRQLTDEQLLELGYPPASLPFIRLKTLFPETVIGRFDFAETGNGLKMLEFNSDTPTFIKECFQMNGLVCREFDFLDPNRNNERLLSSGITRAVLEASKGVSNPNVVFTAHKDHQEDWNTTLYLQRLCQFTSKVVPLSDLKITSFGLLDSDEAPIDVLYRQTYPLEHLLEDKDPNTGDLVGIELLKLVQSGKLSILNPVSSFLLQPKSIQSLIWGLTESGAYYTDEELGWIKEYMLPTYLEPDEFIGKCSFVEKPSFGREGDTVTIWNKNSQIDIQNAAKTYRNELSVFQTYTPLPTVTLETEKGMEELFFVFGSFLIAGKPGSIGIRAGGRITGNESYFLPVGITKGDD